MLDRVSFAGIKSLARVDVDLAPLTVFVGPNGCGKSTILNEIERVCEASWPEPRPSNVLGEAQRVVAPAALSLVTDSQPDTRMCWAGSSGRRRLEISVTRPGRVDWIASLAVGITTDGSNQKVFEVATARDAAGEREKLLADLLWSPVRLRLSPTALRQPSPGASLGLSSEGAGLPTLLVDIATNDQDAYGAIQDHLQTVVPQFSKIRTTKSTESGTTYALSLRMRSGIVVPAAEVSDGTLFALALLAVLHAGTAEIILMDDLDHGLHLGAQVRLLEAIRAVQSQRPNLQVLCTTHSPVLLDSFRPEEVRVMALDAAGHTRVKPLTAHPEFERWSKALTTGEMWANLGEDWVLQDG